MSPASEDRAAGTRSALAIAAREAFARLGYPGASTRGIAEAAGVDVALIKYHFGGKGPLYAEVVTEACDLAFERASARAKGRRGARRVRAISAALVELVREDPTSACLLARALLHPAGDPPCPTPAIVGLIDDALVSVADSGELRPPEPASVRRAWLAALVAPMLAGPDNQARVLTDAEVVTALCLGPYHAIEPRSPTPVEPETSANAEPTKPKKRKKPKTAKKPRKEKKRKKAKKRRKEKKSEKPKKQTKPKQRSKRKKEKRRKK